MVAGLAWGWGQAGAACLPPASLAGTMATVHVLPLAGTGFSSPALSLTPADAAGHPGVCTETLQSLAPQSPRLGDPFAWRLIPPTGLVQRTGESHGM